MPLSSDERKRVEYIQQKLETFKLQLEKLEKYLSGPNAEATNAKIRLKVLSPIFEKALEYAEELRILQPRNPQLEVLDSTEARYYTAASSVTNLQKKDQPAVNDTLNVTAGGTAKRDFGRIPEIRLPTFDGRSENWASFKNKFLATVDSRDDIVDGLKCTLLFDSLTGSALAKVAQFEPSAQDYPNAWKTLLDFYDHKRIMAMKHLDAIIDLPRLNKASAEDLTTLLDVVRPNLHILEGLGARSSDEHLLIRIIERSLPPGVRSRWHDQLKPNDLPKLTDLTDFIQNAIFKQHTFDYSNPQQRNPQQKRSGEHLFQPSRKHTKSPAHTFVTSTPNSSVSPRNQWNCPMCHESHQLFKCAKFNGLTVRDRWAFVNKIRVCQNCLWDHPFRCPGDKKCKRCHQPHHTLLHHDDDSQRTEASGGHASNSGPA